MIHVKVRIEVFNDVVDKNDMNDALQLSEQLNSGQEFATTYTLGWTWIVGLSVPLDLATINWKLSQITELWLAFCKSYRHLSEIKQQ